MKDFEKLSQEEKDILRISKILNVPSERAKEIWIEYSATFCAQWEWMPDNNKDLRFVLKKYLNDKIGGGRKLR